MIEVIDACNCAYILPACVAYLILYFLQAIEDLTKALEFEPNSVDILHERGSFLIIVFSFFGSSEGTSFVL